MSIEPGKLYMFSEPFRSQLIRVLTDMENAKNGNGRKSYPLPHPGSSEYYKAKAMVGKTPTPAQLDLLKRLGSRDMPMNRYEASCMIEELKG